MGRQKKILDAAMRVFSRYGFKRTSMSDIAEEAGVSRQTLYKTFKNKNDVLEAHIRVFTDEAVKTIEERLSQADGLGPQLDLIFDEIVVAGFDLVRASPNAEDVTEGVNQVAKNALEDAAMRHQKLIKRVLSPYKTHLKRQGITLDAAADFVQRSARAIKTNSRDRSHLLKQLDTLNRMVLAAAGIDRYL